MQISNTHYFLDLFFLLLIEKKGCIYPEEIHKEIIKGNREELHDLCVESLLEELIECGFIEFKYSTYYIITKRGNLFQQFIEYQKIKLLKENVVSTRKNLINEQSKNNISFSSINKKLNLLFILISLCTAVLTVVAFLK